MPRILIGWEFGANRGHAERMMGLAAALQAAGHEISFAVQRIDALDPARIGAAPVWQAPVSPRLLVVTAKGRRGSPAGMADILARLGMDDPGLIAAMIRGWQRLFEATRPHVIVADFAPFMLLAARGHLPSIAVGTGVNLPPAQMADLPALINVPGVDQAALLDTANRGLAAAGGAQLTALPRIFEADRAIVATFAELDPYAAHRTSALALPIEEDFDAEAGNGDEVFVYAPETIDPEAPLWSGLSAAGLPVRIHIPRASDAIRDRLADLGFAVEPHPLPFARIAERSRLLLSHGGHGFVCAGLAAGLPQIVFHYDLEKLVHGLALARAGLGGHVSLGAIRPKVFAESLVRVYRDDALAARARAAGPGFRRRGQVPTERQVVAAVAELA